MSTGQVPQELIVRITAGRTSLGTISVTAANIKNIIVERSESSSPGNWSLFDEQELPDVDGRQEIRFKSY